MRTRIAPALLLALLVACGAGDAPGGGGSTAPPPTEPLTPTTVGGSAEVPPEFLDPVVEDAASRAEVTPDEVTVVSAAAVEWPDGSLGCPEPGVSYTQNVVAGYQVMAEAGGQPYDYRLDDQGRFRLCEAAVGYDY